MEARSVTNPEGQNTKSTNRSSWHNFRKRCYHVEIWEIVDSWSKSKTLPPVYQTASSCLCTRHYGLHQYFCRCGWWPSSALAREESPPYFKIYCGHMLVEILESQQTQIPAPCDGQKATRRTPHAFSPSCCTSYCSSSAFQVFCLISRTRLLSEQQKVRASRLKSPTL